ncbi:hypothetical protein COGO111638_03520 [Corynebacterium gottingense]
MASGSGGPSSRLRSASRFMPSRRAENAVAGAASSSAAGRRLTTLPLRMTATWSASVATSMASCVTTIVVRSRAVACSRRRHWAVVAASMAASGSSRMSTRGRAASARTSAIWAACPPDSAGTGTSASDASPAARSSCSALRVTIASAVRGVAVGGSAGSCVSSTTPRCFATPLASVVFPAPFGPMSAVVALAGKRVAPARTSSPLAAGRVS